MTRKSVRQADVTRLVRGAEAAGLTVEAVEITVDGCARILTRRPEGGVAANDQAAEAEWDKALGLR